MVSKSLAAKNWTQAILSDLCHLTAMDNGGYIYQGTVYGHKPVVFEKYKRN